VVNAGKGQTLTGSPEAIAACQVMADRWVADKSKPTGQQSAACGWDGFLSGVSTKTVWGHWSVPNNSTVAFKSDIAPLTQGPAGRATPVNPAGFVIGKDTKTPAAVWEVVKYALLDAGQTELAKTGLTARCADRLPKSAACLGRATKIDHSVYVLARLYAHMRPVFKGYDECPGGVSAALHTITFLSRMRAIPWK